MENGEDKEVVFRNEDHEREDEPEIKESAPPTPITHCDMDIIIRGWEEKFMKMMECLREVQMTSERASSDMCLVSQEARAQGQEHERRLADFLRKVENARIPTTPHVNALRASTPRICPEFGYNTSPVGRDEVSHPELNTLPHTRSARTEDQPDSMETHMGSAHSTLRTSGVRAQGITTTLSGTRATRCRTPVVRAQGNNLCSGTRSPGNTTTLSGTRAPGNTATTETRAVETYNFVWMNNLHTKMTGGTVGIFNISYHPGNTSSFAHQSSSPKVPTFDGTNTAQFRPWIIQFEAIARHQGWTAGERVVRLVSSLTGPAANLLIGMTLGQLDNYNFLRTRLSRRYDPPEREEAHRAELRARTRRRNESADEFAENIKNLAQRAYPLADQNMLDNLVVERFREGHGNEELKKHLCLYPSTGLQDLIGACMRFETHVELGLHARKSNEGLYTVQSGNRNELTLEEVTRAARRLGFELRPWIVRQQNSRGFSNTSPARNQNSGEQQQSPKPNQSGNGSARTQNPLRRQTPVGDVKCWTCGKTGHYAYDCKSSGPKFAFAPKALKMNFLQQIADQVQEYSEEQQNPRSGND